MIRNSLFILVLLVPLSVSAADQVVLKEGKTIHGTITQEDANEVSIKTGSNMYLRIDKSKVREIKRGPKTAPARPSVRMDQLTPAATVAAPAPSTPTAATPAAPAMKTEKPELLHMKAVSRTTSRKEGGVQIFDTLSHQLYEVKAAKFSEAKKAVSHTDWTVTWKDGVLRSTISVRAPDWVPAVKPSDEDILAWNQFIKEKGDYEAGRVKIYQETVNSLAGRLDQMVPQNDKSLQAESEGLVKKAQEQADKRIQGYMRRTALKK